MWKIQVRKLRVCHLKYQNLNVWLKTNQIPEWIIQMFYRERVSFVPSELTLTKDAKKMVYLWQTFKTAD